MEEYLVICWNCAQEFDALSAQWCGCSAITPTKVCPYCFSCMCNAPESYKKSFWKAAPKSMREEKSSLNTRKDRLGDVLVKQNIITNDQLLNALSEQKKSGEKLGAILVRLGYVHEGDINRALSQQTGMMSIDLEHIEIDENLVADIGIDLIKKYRMIPVEKQELPTKKMITIAVDSPMAAVDMEKIQKTVGYTIYPVLANDKIFEKMFSKLVSQKSVGQEKAKIIHGAKVKLNALITEAIKRKASEIIFEPAQQDLTVHFLIGGKLFAAPNPPFKLANQMLRRLKALAKIDDSSSDGSPLSRDGSFKVKAKDKTYEFIVQFQKTPTGDKVVVTVVNEALYHQGLQKLVLDPLHLRILQSLLKVPQGIFILLGPHNSGRHMLLYSLLQSYRNTNRKVISIEEPVLCDLPTVIQRRWHSHGMVSLQDMVENATNDFPDVLALPDIDDAQTAQLVFEKGAEMVIFVVVNALAPSEVLLHLSGLGLKKTHFKRINAFINLRMLPSLCQNCREQRIPDEDEAAFLELSKGATKAIFRSTGCDKCYGSGYAGFIPLVETIPLDSKAKKKLDTEKDFLWCDTYTVNDKARTIKKLARDLVLKGWLFIDDVRQLDVDENVSQLSRNLPSSSSSSSNGETDKISLY